MRPRVALFAVLLPWFSRLAAEADPTAKERIFLFDEGRNLTAEMVRWAQAHGVRVVPSINVYHYYDPATMTGKRATNSTSSSCRRRANISRRSRRSA